MRKLKCRWGGVLEGLGILPVMTKEMLPPSRPMQHPLALLIDLVCLYPVMGHIKLQLHQWSWPRLPVVCLQAYLSHSIWAPLELQPITIIRRITKLKVSINRLSNKYHSEMFTTILRCLLRFWVNQQGQSFIRSGK